MRLPSIRDIFGHDFKPESVRLSDLDAIPGFKPGDFKRFTEENHHKREPVNATLHLSNNLVYYGNHNNPLVSCEPRVYHNILRNFYAREKEIYSDQYDKLVNHDPDDPRVNELLIQDAIKTGCWRELPKPLLAEYHKRMTNL